jgi:hypothetical protein
MAAQDASKDNQLLRVMNRFASTFGVLTGRLIIAMLLVALPALAGPQSANAQQPAADPPPTAAAAKIPAANSDPPDALRPAPVIKDDRVFGVMPNFSTVENQHEFGPISVKGKFKLASQSSFDPYTFAFVGFEALISQAQDSEPAYKQGLIGYAKRYGTSYGDAVIGTFMTTAVAPSLFREDPRYFQLGTGTAFHRAVYSASRILITRKDSGGEQFNYAEITGNLVAAGISNIYHPDQERTLPNTLSVWGTDIMWDAVANELKEFWPDIHHKLSRHKNVTATP